MRIVYSLDDNSIVGLTEVAYIVKCDEFGYVDIPMGFVWDDRILWIYDESAKAVIKKEGPELDDALRDLAGRSAERLIAKYAGSTVSPQTIVLLEGACDLVVQVLNSWVNDIPLTAEETERWNEFYAQCAPFFVNELQGLSDDDIRDMSVAKSIARQIKVDMKADPEWPKEE